MTVSVVRTVFLYLLLLVAVRLMGKRQLGELQPSELVVTLLLSDLAAVPMQENGLPLANGVLPILVLISLELLLSGLMVKCPRIAHLASGSPLCIIRDGKISRSAMRRLRITMDDLAEDLRQQGIFDIRQVQYAIVETGGHISTFLYPAHQPATAADVKANNRDEEMPAVVISDGQLSQWGLDLCGATEEQVDRLLQKRRITRDKVFLMTLTPSGKHYLLTQNDVKGGAT